MLLKSLTAAAALLLAPVAARAQAPFPPPAAQPSGQNTLMFGAVDYTQPTAAAPGQIAWGPGPIGCSLAALGRAMARLDQRHVWTIQHTRYRRLRPVAQYYAVTQTPAAYTSPYYNAAGAPQYYGLTSPQAGVLGGPRFFPHLVPAPVPAPAPAAPPPPAPLSLPKPTTTADLSEEAPPAPPMPEVPAVSNREILESGQMPR